MNYCNTNNMLILEVAFWGVKGGAEVSLVGTDTVLIKFL